MSTINQRVKAGIAAINKYYGNTDWVSRIDLDLLDQACTDCCVIGQLDLPDNWDGLGFGWFRAEHAAELQLGETKADFAEMTKAWKTQLQLSYYPLFR